MSGGWDTVALGLQYSSGMNPVDLTVDDVTVALYSDMSPAVHIGCAP